MANKIDLDTIAKEYAEGRISKEDFLYLHKMLTNPPGKKKSPAEPQPPVLKPVHQVKAAPRQQQARRPAAQRTTPKQATQASQPRRTIRPQVTQPQAQPAPEPRHFHQTAPAFLVEERRASTFGYIRKHHKEVVALLGTVGIFISMFYNNFQSPSVDSNNARVVVIQSQQGEQSSVKGLRTQDIKLIAELMMEDNSWNKELIDDFLAQWNRLSNSEKQSIKQTEWYNRFSAMLSQQIKIAQTKATTGNVSAIYNQQALMVLADNLIFGDSKEARDALQTYASSDTKTTRKAESKNESKKESDSSKPKAAEKTVSQPVQNAKIANETVKSKSEKSARDESEKNRHRITRQEIEDVMNRFTVAFEAGHTRDLMALFPDEEYSSSYTGLSRVKQEHKELFQTSQDRRLDLSSFFWEHDFDEARGTAKYKANIIKDKSTGETVTANLDITLRRLMGKVYITGFKLSDRDVVAHTTKAVPAMARQAVDVGSKSKPKHPTPAELQDLVTQYITAYETGDVTELMHLFANATWTSSRTGLVEMKQNYQNLFSTTNGREMFVKNINWNFKDKKALGTGELVLSYHTKDDQQIVTQTGKIRFVATRHGDNVRFTQMFHIVE
jgi:hypothetical protein